MGFHVDLASLKSDADAYFKGAEKTIGEMESTKAALNKIVTSNALYGSAGEAVSNDVNNNLNAMLTALKDEYREVSIGFKQDIQGFKNAVGEGSDSAVLDEDTLNKLVTKLDQMAKDQDDLAKNGKKIFASIDDIIALSAPHSSFPAGTRETKKQIKKIITKVTEFDQAKGVEPSLVDLLKQTNTKLSQAERYGDSGYTDTGLQGYLANADFAAQVAKFDQPIEKGIKEEAQAKLDAKKSEAEWAEHHPAEALWQKVEKVVANFWQSVQQFNDTDPETSDFEKDLKKFTSGILGTIVEIVGSGVTLVAVGFDTSMEVNDRQTGFADKYEQHDLNKKGENVVNLFAHPIKDAEGIADMVGVAVGGVGRDIKTKNLYRMGGDLTNGLSLLAGAGEVKGAIDSAEAVAKLNDLRKVDTILSQSTAETSSLVKYMKASDRAAFKSLRKDGTWNHKVLVPKAESVLTKRGTIDWLQVPQGGYIINESGMPIKYAISPHKGSIIDRFGPSKGRYTSPVAHDGMIVGYSNRSLPYVMDFSQYNQYEFVDDFSNLRKYVDSTSDVATRRKIEGIVKHYYRGDWNKVKVYQGQAAKGFGSTGGGIQTELPFSVGDLEKIGLIRKIK